MTNTPTPHNAAKFGDIAPKVVMAGDPLRVKYIAENYLTDAVLYNEVRGMLGYTGFYKGERISVQGHGMGIPSIGIYSYELFNFYGVEQITRIGTCGSFKADTRLGSLIMVQAASTDSSYGTTLGVEFNYSPVSDFGLLQKAVGIAQERGLDFQVGNVMSSDVFYNPDKHTDWKRFGILAVEMEAYGLFVNAALAGKKAMTILSVTDNAVTGEKMSSEQRQKGLNDMIGIALEL